MPPGDGLQVKVPPQSSGRVLIWKATFDMTARLSAISKAVGYAAKLVDSRIEYRQVIKVEVVIWKVMFETMALLSEISNAVGVTCSTSAEVV